MNEQKSRKKDSGLCPLTNLFLLYRSKSKPECFPVGCVPPALYRSGGGLPLTANGHLSRRGGLCPGVVSVQRGRCPGEVSVRGSLSVNGRNMGPKTEIPLDETWDQAAREEVTSYRDPLDRMKDVSKNITCPKLRLRAVINWCIQ